MDKLFTHIDIYCERTNNQFWAEPVNACTNIFFVMVGVYLLITLKKMQATSKWLKFLAINCIVVGLGSFLFHTFANFLTMWADILPIMLLICSTFLYIIRYIFDISWRVSMLIITLF
ncbi:MAG: ceramidase domain-containing protein, partial [Bdellovibrionales bacterium]|nr:ceramidase domain-containing protein [Bdellovibrionales bacterium]